MFCIRAVMSCMMLALLALSMAGCASVISSEVRKEAVPEISLREVARDPERYLGKVVIWSGTILEARNTDEGTVLKIIEKPADYQGRPKYVDESSGRFLALEKRFLDPAIFAKGRAVTVAGEIEGKEVMPLGDIEYTYPVVRIRELHLSPEERIYPPYGYPYPFWYPYYGYPHLWWRYYYW